MAMKQASRIGTRTRGFFLGGLGLFFLASPTWAETPTAKAEATFTRQVEARLQSLREELIEVRRDLHRHPELSGQEKRTARVVASRLQRLGLEVRTGVGGHGVVAVIEGSRPTPVVAFRADMDAVASSAPDPVPFRSQNPGVRHLCGHDIHTTIGLALAEVLVPLREQLPGSVKLIFQPAEESLEGARAMLADGAFEDPRPLGIFAVHSAPEPVGRLGAGLGQALAGRDLVKVVLSTGDQGEGAIRQIQSILSGLNTLRMPAGGVSPEPVTEPFVQAFLLQVEPGPEPGQQTLLGQITPSHSKIRAETRARLAQKLDGLKPKPLVRWSYHEEYASGIFNEPRIVEAMKEPILRIVGQDGLEIREGTVPFFSEDFGFFQKLAPGVMYWLGVADPENVQTGLPHSPSFVAEEESIFVGTRAMAEVLRHFLETQAEMPSRRGGGPG